MGSKKNFGLTLINLQLLFPKYCSVSALSCSFEFVVWVGGFLANTLSQPNYNFGCFVVGVVAVVGLCQMLILENARKLSFHILAERFFGDLKLNMNKNLKVLNQNYRIS